MTDREGMIPQGPWEGEYFWLEIMSVDHKEEEFVGADALGEGVPERYPPREEGY